MQDNVPTWRWTKGIKRRQQKMDSIRFHLFNMKKQSRKGRIARRFKRENVIRRSIFGKQL